MKKKILFVVTSHDRLGNTNNPTGYYLSEVSHPWSVLISAGYEIDFVSPKGGKAPAEAVDLTDEINKAFWENSVYRFKIEHTLNYYEEKDLTLKFARYKDMKHGALVQMKDINRFLFWFCCFYYLCYEIKMSIKHRTLHLFKVVYH